MFEEVVLVRRRSPDWTALAADFRRGVRIERSRYIPPEGEIPGLSPHLGDDIDRWNARFRTDFFTYRSVLAQISEATMGQVRHARHYGFSDTAGLVQRATRTETYFYFHDDDDFYAPDLLAAIRSDDATFDAIVTPMFRIGQRISTFVRRGFEAEWTWGERSTPGGRYQTNNYGIHSRHCASAEALSAVTEHVHASATGDRQGFRDRVLATTLSATIKTPGSASALRQVFDGEDRLQQMFETFIRTLAGIELPDRYGWLAEPAGRVRRLVECVYGGVDCAAGAGEPGARLGSSDAVTTPLKRADDPV